MNEGTREKLLKVALVAFGAISSSSTPWAWFGRRGGFGTVDRLIQDGCFALPPHLGRKGVRRGRTINKGGEIQGQNVTRLG
jgi:hypothetical protein